MKGATTRNYIDVTGQRFGRLVALRRAPNSPSGRVCLEFKCDCGTVRTMLKGPVVGGATKSCGCLGDESRTKHGEHPRGKASPEYKTWQNIHSRTAEKSENAKNYAARGITVCERWGTFSNFLADMGRKPTPEHTIERIDNRLGYFPGNCKWATRSEQNRNHRRNVLITANGVTKCLVDWSRDTGIPYATLQYRRRLGLSDEEIVSPLNRKTGKGFKR